MRNLRVLLAFTPLLFSITTIQAQDKKTTLNEPKAVSELVEVKKRANSINSSNDNYRIQIFYGDNKGSKDALSDFRNKFPTLEANVVYSNPSYKVMAGNFKTRLEAERNLQLILKDFPYALMIRPGK